MELRKIIIISLSIIAVAAFILWIALMPHLSEGEVIYKNYQPAYTYTSTTPISNGKTTTYMVQTHYVSEKFILGLRGKTEKGEEIEDWIYVSGREYEGYEVGEWYPRRSQGGVIK